MPAYAQAIIIVMYSTISVLAVGGNLIVVYIVVAYQRMRTVTNYFIVNLACSDILMAVMCIPFTFIANLLMHYWPFGAIMCPIVSYLQAVVVFLSAFTLVAISLDRYRAIMFPLKPRMTTNQVAMVIAVIWMLSLAVPLPIAIMSRIEEQTDRFNASVVRYICKEKWPQLQHRYIYSLCLMILQYFLPLFVLMFTYSSIAVVIWVKKMPGEAENNRDQRMAASKRKMVKMMITVVIIYALCWLPLHTVTIVGDVHESVWHFRHIQVLWSGAHWLAMSNCCYNPIVYCWMNSKFRQGFKYSLRCQKLLSRRKMTH
ncbi:hypothetical protein CAPTEDRAFT_195613 [Capitella teleta]|uniref:G-protein coupled receptors family 1 profile domain-containing protein n=1 Tax=Capitella teleta TaxID=283909 RepID=R7TR01_CAPTE|nr:hypothetical protein CAPTEDRAFT_195613 [Capitella teleta]|eukprot:ELT96089.1 hypothetical protein CAPTEDRAFT_195613 [Capitella teleta]